MPGGQFTDLDTLPLTLAADPAPAADAGPAPQGPGTVAPGTQPGDGGAPAPQAPPQANVPAQADGAEAPIALDPPHMRRIVFLATSRPGDGPPFAKTQPNLNGEGLRYGLGRFTQISGDLGRLLLAMKHADETLFNTVFGAEPEFLDASPDELLAVTSALAPAGVEADAAPNMQMVAGRPLWSPEWIKKFKTAAGHSAFQDAQYATAAHTALLPMLGFARDMGLDSEKGITLLTERAIQLGVLAARAFVVTAAGPIKTEALKREALVFLADDPNAATLSAFQAAHGLPDTGGRLNANSHAALVAALRSRADSPVMLPSQAMMFDLIANAAATSPVPGLIAGIRANSNLSEAPLSAADPVME